MGPIESISPLTAIGLAVFITILLVILQHRKNDTLSGIPGPFISRWTNLWEVYNARLGRRYMAVHELHKKYGPIIRTSPTHVSIADKEAIPLIYSHGVTAMAKSPYYDAFVSEEPSIFSTRDRADHAQKRKFYANTFSPKAVRSYGTAVHQLTHKLFAKLDERASSMKNQNSEFLDLLTWVNYLSFDILSALVFGEPLGMVEKESDILLEGSKRGAIDSIDEREHFLAVIGWSTFIQKIAPYVPDPLFRRGSDGGSDLVKIAQECIKRRLQSGAERNDILGHLISAQKELSGEINERDLISESITLLIAGTDATTNAITSIVHMVVTHPEVLAKLRSELESAYGKGNEPSPEDDLTDLPYLQTCIMEALRWHSPTAMGLPRVSTGFHFKGHWFPPGINVSVPTWTLQHDSTIFGDDAYIYRPERWIEDPGLIKYFMAFSSGARACLGRNLAYLEMRMIVAMLIQRYDIVPRSTYLETTEKLMHKPVEEWVTLRRRNVD